MLDVQTIAMWVSWIVTIAGGFGLVLKPFLKSLDNINKSLADTSKTIQQLKNEMEQSKRDNKFFYDKIEKHEERLDHHKNCLTQHNEQLKILMGERGR